MATRADKASQGHDQTDGIYTNICGLWFARMLAYSPPSERISRSILVDDDCQKLLDLSPIDEISGGDKTTITRKLKAHVRKIMACRKASLDGTPLGENIDYLGDVLNLSRTERGLIALGVLIKGYRAFRGSVSAVQAFTSLQQSYALFAAMLGVTSAHIKDALAADGALAQSGLIRISGGIDDLEDTIVTPANFEMVMLVPHENRDDLIREFIHPCTLAKLDEIDFSHIDRDLSLIRGFLTQAAANGCRGVNILLYGAPGVGKTEFVKLLAKQLGSTLYEVSYEDKEGAPVDSVQRLSSYSLCQRLLAHDKKSLILFDEIEDVFSDTFGGLLGKYFGNKTEKVAGKAWINRTLEGNPVPAVWVSNNIDQIDPAYLRRFDYALEIPRPPRQARLRIIKKYLGELNLPNTFIERLANWENLTPAQLEKAARVTKLSAQPGSEEARQISEQVLRASAKMLDISPPLPEHTQATTYSLDYVNADLDIARVAASLKLRPRGTFLFHGPPGTGKTALARHLAEVVDRPLMVRRASDLLSMWVGGSEKNIAAMFRQAAAEDAVLVLDEADGLLSDRGGARQSWEVTQVNEMLTHMEDFQGIFICTTNLLERLDTASLRRFAFKVRFDFLTAQQRHEFFLAFWKKLAPSASELSNQALNRLDRLDVLTPGDFAAVARRQEIIGNTPSADELLDALEEECRIKGVSSQPIGFLA